MIVVLKPAATEEDATRITAVVEASGGLASKSSVHGHHVIVVSSAPTDLSLTLQDEAIVDRIVSPDGPAQLVSTEYDPKRTVIDVSGVALGGDTFVVIAGPCAVESMEQVLETARQVKGHGARILRGDAFKPRTSPYTFQGLGEEGLKMLADIRDETGLPFVAECLDPRDVDLVASYADAIRVGTRNMSNYSLLSELGHQPRPVLLKRGRSATVDEWLSAAEYVYSSGNPNIALVERGIRTFESSTRNTLDISAVPLARKLTHLPVLVDPSHSSGRADLVPALCRAALAVGADGILVDVHPKPEQALVDGDQALSPAAFGDMMNELRVMGSALGVNL